MQYLLLLILAVVFTFQSLFAKLYSDHYTGEEKMSSPVYSVLYGFVVALITLATNSFVYQPSLQTFLMGLANAFMVFLYNYALIEGSRRGPYSFVMICMLFGGVLTPMLVLFVAGLEILSPIRWVGVAIMLVAFVLLNLTGETQKKPKRFFFFWAAVLGLSNGVYSTLLSLQTLALGGAQRAEMLVTTFFFSGIISTVYLLFSARKRFFSVFRIGKKPLLFAICACFAATAGANFLMYLLSIMDATVVNATNQGSVLVLSVFISLLLFKERMNWKQVLGSVLCTISIVMLNI